MNNVVSHPLCPVCAGEPRCINEETESGGSRQCAPTSSASGIPPTQACAGPQGLLRVPGPEHLLGVCPSDSRRERGLRVEKVSQGPGLGLSVRGWEPPGRLHSCSAPVPRLSLNKEAGSQRRPGLRGGELGKGRKRAVWTSQSIAVSASSS